MVDNKCTRCNRSDICHTNRMKGRGNTKSQVMFIGDYPHIEADLTGEAFTGRIPDILMNYLRKNGLRPEEYYFTYAVKCSGDNITKEHIKACRPYLDFEIVKLKPKYIITLGNESLQAVTGRSGILKYRGNEMEKEFEFKGETHKATIIPMLSPASIDRLPKYKKMFVADLNKLYNLLVGDIKQPEHNIVYCIDNNKLVKAINHGMRAVKEGLPIGFDLETEGFDYWRPEKVIVSMSLSIEDYSYTIPLGHDKSPYKKCWVKVLKYFKHILENGKIVTQNGKFDAKWLQAKAGIEMRFFFDTMLASYLIDENTPHHLGYLSQVYLNVPSYKEMVDKTKIKSEPLMDVLRYNALDTHYTVRLYEPLKERLLQNPRLANLFKRLMMRAFEMYKRIEMVGIWVDPTLLNERYKICMDNLKRLEREINQYVTPEFVDLYLTKRYKTRPDKIEPFNMNSPKQMAALLYEQPPVGLGLPITMTTGSGAPSTSEEAIVYLKDQVQHPILDLLLEHRGWEQNRKMFLTPWTENRDHNSRLHSNYKLLTVTGRTSCEEPNIQQVPRDPFMRGIIGAPPGKVFLEFDYSQIELRVCAFIANERTMKRIYQTGGDIHRTTASTVAGKPPEQITKEERKAAKAINFGYVYGAWWKTFKKVAKMKYGIDFSDEECQHSRERFFELYSDLPKWHEKYKNMARQLGKVISPNGRERRLPDIYSSDYNIVHSAENEAINAPVQGFGSDITVSAAIDIYEKYIKPYPIGESEIEIIASVHDAILFEVDEDKVFKWIPIIKKEMEDKQRLKDWYGVDFTVPIEADGAIGRHWGYVMELEPHHYEDLTKINLADLK